MNRFGGTSCNMSGTLAAAINPQGTNKDMALKSCLRQASCELGFDFGIAEHRADADDDL